jgi:acyl-CoA dehydrogenase
MNFEISEELRKTQLDIREFVQNELMAYAQVVEDSQRIPDQILDKMRKKGLFGATIPKEYGGAGMGKLEFCLVEEELVKAHFAFQDIISLNNGLGSKGIVLDGSEELKKKYLPRLASGELISAFALTEPNAGSDAASITTSAVRQGDYYILNGLKHFITNAPIADVFVVIVVTDPEKGVKGGMSAFLVERDTPGVSIGHIHNSMGMHGTHKSEIIFKDAKVPVYQVIGEVGYGFITAMKTVDDGRMGVAAASLGMASRLLELCTDYARKMERDGKSIASYQSMQWLLSDMATEIYAARTMIYMTAAQIDGGKHNPMNVAMCKLYASEMVNRAVQKAMEIIGKDAFRYGNEVERICRDARILTIFEGTSEIHRIIIGRSLLKGFLPDV